jgi:polar amino acid transport system substrate-binding protein
MNLAPLPLLPAVGLLAIATLLGCGSATPATSSPALGTAAPLSPAAVASPSATPTASIAPTPSPTPTPSASTSPSPAVAISPSASASISPVATPSPVASATLADELATPGTLTACTTFGSVAFATYDAAGKAIGVNADIDAELARRLDLTPTIQDMKFSDLIDAVVAGRCDISVSSQIILQARLARIDMIPYTKGVPHLDLRAGDTSIKTVLDACGRKIGLPEGSFWADYIHGTADYAGRGLDQKCAAAKRAPADLRLYADEQLAVGALESGEVDIFIGNDFIALQRPTVFKLGPELPPLKQGIGVAKGHPALRRAVDAALKAMIKDGTYKAILHRYGADLVSI